MRSLLAAILALLLVPPLHLCCWGSLAAERREACPACPCAMAQGAGDFPQAPQHRPCCEGGAARESLPATAGVDLAAASSLVAEPGLDSPPPSHRGPSLNPERLSPLLWREVLPARWRCALHCRWLH